ncbi:(-)-germacrene D synthase [Vitis vinifera]|uniref:(-)-germacrene D synthase n=1 Tax=Vitis vinifera TaxID=29760 RepID=A0A438DPH8_VITVI|nr:(-)-germacrene D synthase [Vitis vinifera]
MSVQSSVVLLAPSKNLSPENTDDHLKQHVQQLKEEVRKMLMAADDDSAQKLL